MPTRFKGKDKLKGRGLMLAKRGCHRKAGYRRKHSGGSMHALWPTARSMSARQRRREANVAGRAA